MKRSLKYGLLVPGLVVLGSGLCLARPPASNPGDPFAELQEQHLNIQQQQEAIESQVDSIDYYLQFSAGDRIDRIIALLKTPLRIEVRVDTKACASSLVQCSGHPSSPANDQNDNPIRMFVQVSDIENPADGLSPENFELSSPFYPGGGRAFQFCEENCGDEWFQVGGNGLYSIFLEPLPQTPTRSWKAGTYAGTVKVRLPSGTRGVALVSFEVPVATNLVQ
jgi:hypothetical protein